MSDPRLNSGHFLCSPRREEYRRCRDVAVGARGWLTLAGECARGVVGEIEGPAQVLPGTRFLLYEPARECAYPLQTGLNTIGRLGSNDIVFEENVISRRHGILLVHAWGSCELHDTASRNGTYVNGQRIGPSVPLHSGDRVQLCDRRSVFLSEKDCEAAAGGDAQGDTAWVVKSGG